MVGDDDLELGWSESDDDEEEEPKKEEIKKSDEKPLNGVHDDTVSLQLVCEKEISFIDKTFCWLIFVDSYSLCIAR